VPKSANTWFLSKSSLQAPEMKPMQLIVPLQTQLTATLPAGDRIDHNYNPFPETQVFVHELQDKVRAFSPNPVSYGGTQRTRVALVQIEIMGSLQRPKKITMVGSDGQEYLFLCKPKDDLRKDCRMMEFNTMINKLLKKHPETRRRKLRTFSLPFARTLDTPADNLVWCVDVQEFERMLWCLLTRNAA
jgi:serine/threonine-protein kinase ATR